MKYNFNAVFFLKKNARFKNIINKLEYLSFGLMASRWP